VRKTDDHVIYLIDQPALFEKGSSRIGNNAEALLVQVAGSINKRFGNNEIRIYDLDYDAKKSDKASAVKSWLKERVPAAHIDLAPSATDQIYEKTDDKNKQQKIAIVVNTDEDDDD
jgi:hypothetical protein